MKTLASIVDAVRPGLSYRHATGRSAIAIPISLSQP